MIFSSSLCIVSFLKLDENLMKTDNAQSMVLDISFFDRSKNDLERLHAKIENSLNYLESPDIIVRQEELPKLIRLMRRMLGKFRDLEAHVPQDVRRRIINSRRTYENVCNDVLSLADKKGVSASYMEYVKSILYGITNDVVQVVDEQLTTTINLPSYEELKERLHYKSANPVFTRESFQIYRRVWHALAGSIAPLAYLFLPVSHTLVLTVTASIAAITIPLDVARLHFPSINRRFMSSFKLLLRNEEKAKLNTMTYFLIGVLVSITFYPKIIAVLSILFLAWGDPTAAIVGIKYGKNKLLWGKSLEGFLGAAFMCATVSYILMSYYFPNSFNAVFIFSVLAGFTGATAEVLPTKLDDNVTIPIISGLFMTVFYYILF